MQAPTENTVLAIAPPAKSKPTRMQRLKSFGGKVSAVITGSMLSASAFAQSANDIPASLDGVVEFMRSKGLIAVGVAAVITLIYLGITGAKLPRRGS